MAQIKVTSVQYPMVFTAEITYEEIGDDVTIDLQPGFVLQDISVIVVTGFNGTTPTLSAVDNMATPNTVVASAAIAAAGTVLPLVSAEKGNYYPAGGKIMFKPVVAGGTPSAGKALILLQGVVMGRQNERVGTANAT